MRVFKNVHRVARVFIVDGNETERAHARAAVSAGAYRVVGEAADTAVALEHAPRHRPDVVLLDLALPNGLAGLSDLREALPSAAIVAYADVPDRRALALAAGADGFVLKTADADAFVATLDRARAEVPVERSSSPFGPAVGWSALLDAIHEAVVIRDARGVIVFANGAAQELFGLTVRGLAHRAEDEDPTLEWLRADETALPTSELPGLVALRTGASARAVVIGARSRTRGLRWLSATATPFPSASTAERPAGVVTVFTDVTEGLEAERALQASENRFRTAMDTMLVGLAIYTARRNEYGQIEDLVCEYMNDAVVEHGGLAPAAQLGRGMLEIFPNLADVGLFQQYATVVETGTPLRLDIPWYESDVVSGAFEISASKLGDGCVMVFRDLTSIRRTEEALRVANEEIHQFAAVAAHDMAEPLRALSGFAELLGNRIGDQLDPEARRWLDFILDGSRDLRVLLDAVLAYARAGSTPLQREAVDLGEVARAARAAIQLLLADAGATLTIEPLPVVQGDSIQLRRVLQNLLTNAAKFARPDVAPRIAIDAERDGEMWQIRVIDNGIGVPAAERTRIFEAFHRLHSRDAIAGSGLGLAACRTIVERLGGRIWVEPAPEAGSRVCFTLPSGPVEGS